MYTKINKIINMLCGYSFVSLVCEACFAKSFASHPKAQYWSEKNIVNPRDVFLNSISKFIFVCGDHEFSSRVCDINAGTWCSICHANKLCFDDKCLKCFKKSFASSPKVKFFSSKNDQIPRQISLASNKKFLFDCTCGHEFTKSLNSIKRGRWCLRQICLRRFSRRPSIFSEETGGPRQICLRRFSRRPSIVSEDTGGPFCANQKLCDDEKCKICFDKSFAFVDKSKYWSIDKNILTPRKVLKNSRYVGFFNCNKCNHIFESKTNNIINDQWYPYCCTAARKLCSKKCDLCYNKSFASHPMSKFGLQKMMYLLDSSLKVPIINIILIVTNVKIHFILIQIIL